MHTFPCPGLSFLLATIIRPAYFSRNSTCSRASCDRIGAATSEREDLSTLLLRQSSDDHAMMPREQVELARKYAGAIIVANKKDRAGGMGRGGIIFKE